MESSSNAERASERASERERMNPTKAVKTQEKTAIYVMDSWVHPE